MTLLVRNYADRSALFRSSSWPLLHCHFCSCYCSTSACSSVSLGENSFISICWWWNCDENWDLSSHHEILTLNSASLSSSLYLKNHSQHQNGCTLVSLRLLKTPTNDCDHKMSWTLINSILFLGIMEGVLQNRASVFERLTAAAERWTC